MRQTRLAFLSVYYVPCNNLKGKVNETTIQFGFAERFNVDIHYITIIYRVILEFHADTFFSQTYHGVRGERSHFGGGEE